MADNYLEKKMEEYRRGVQKPPMRRSPSGNKPHTALMPCNLRKAFIVGTDSLSDLLLACAREIRETSCRVAFCATNHRIGTETAQAYGLQFYPIDDCLEPAIAGVFAKASSNLGDIDLIVREIDGELLVEFKDRKCLISKADDCGDEIFIKAASRLVVFLSLSQSVDLKLSGKFTVMSDGHVCNYL